MNLRLIAFALLAAASLTAAAAGLSQLIARGAIKKGENTVLVLTGSGLKASETIGKLLKLAVRF